MKVLIAEDDPVTRRLLQSHLERWGHEVTAAADGDEAWRRFQAGNYPLVISDWMMPAMDGPELVRRIRDCERPGYVYVILLTARSEKEDVVQGMEAGANDFVTKPFDREELRVRVRAGERIVALEHSLAEQNRALREAQAALVQHEKLASLGRLAAGMAHEINNPLAYVSNNLTVLRRDMRAAMHVLDTYRLAVSRIEDRGSRIEEGGPRCGPVSGPGHCGGPHVSGEARQGDLRSATVAGSGDPATTGGGSRIEEGGHPPSPILDPQFSALVAEAARLEEEMDLAYFREHLERMCDKSLQGLQRVRDIVRNLRDFAHLDEAEFKEADLNAALESAIEILRHEIKTRGLQLQEQLHPLPPLLCHPGKINQVFLNLLANAVQACETGGTITVRSRLDPRSSILDPRSSEILDSRQGVVIEVEDTGCGIKPEHLPRIFEPFFTTKPVGQGTGLGLAVSFGIVRDHGGTIEVESSPGRGSTFRVRLPLHPHQPGEAPREGETSRETTP